ncbi:MAG: tRNA dihydrouridine synthase DusB [Magnetococcales bacterium]|nr:tRNA dihydrouridine synthase DusB [Magnetococcales bacterium]
MTEKEAFARLFAPDRPAIPVILAPMAGVTDWPFRALAHAYGAEMTVSEMVASQAMIRHTPKSLKMASPDPLHCSREPVRAVQIAGADPVVMARAARMNVDLGATLIDINMGCPVKKIAKSQAGAALMRDEGLAARIMEAVVAAVPVPVTVKMRLGWDDGQRNGLAIARLAESVGICAITVHGRTRAQHYSGQADWQAIGAIKAGVTIPVIGNGDVCSPEGARELWQQAGVDGIMIGRGSLGRPWIFREVAHYLRTGERLPAPGAAERREMIIRHFEQIIAFHGPYLGNRLARKHLAWHTRGMVGGASFRQQLNHSPDATRTADLLRAFLAHSQFAEEP